MNSNDEDENPATGTGSTGKAASSVEKQGKKAGTYQAQDIPRVVPLLSAVLERLISRNEKSSSSWRRRQTSVFHATKPPSISIPRYLERIFKYTNCSPSCFIVGYVYIDRLVHRHPDLPITSFNVHRLLVTSVMLASKVLDDVHFNNAFFARVGGITTLELNRLELEFLFELDFRLTVNIQEYQSYCLYLDREAPAATGVSCFSAMALASRMDRDRAFTFDSMPNSPKRHFEPKSKSLKNNSIDLKIQPDSRISYSSKMNLEEKNTSGNSSSSSSHNYKSIFAINYEVAQTPDRPLYSPSR